MTTNEQLNALKSKKVRISGVNLNNSIMTEGILTKGFMKDEWLVSTENAFTRFYSDRILTLDMQVVPTITIQL